MSTPEIEQRIHVRRLTKGLQPNKLPYQLALLPVSGVHLVEAPSNKEAGKIRDRVKLTKNTKALQHHEFSVKILHCRDLANPLDESFIVRIQRDK